MVNNSIQPQPIAFNAPMGQTPHSSAMAMQQASVARQTALINTGGKRRRGRFSGGTTTTIPVINTPYNSGLVNNPSNQQVSGTSTLLNGRAQGANDNVPLVPHKGGYKYSKKGRGRTSKRSLIRDFRIGGKRRKSKTVKRRRTKRRM